MKIVSETIIPDNFVTKEWLVEYLDKKFKELGTVVKPPPIPEPEVPVLPDCKKAPEIKSITIVNDKQLKINFWGEGVAEIKFTLFDKDLKEIETLTFVPKNDTPTIDLKNKLTTGNYVAKFEGTKCKGESTKGFTYSNVIVAPPPVTPPIQTKGALDTTLYYNNK